MFRILYNLIPNSKVRHTVCSSILLITLTLLFSLILDQGLSLLCGGVITMAVGFIVEKLGVWDEEDIHFDLVGVFIGSGILIAFWTLI